MTESNPEKRLPCPEPTYIGIHGAIQMHRERLFLQTEDPDKTITLWMTFKNFMDLRNNSRRLAENTDSENYRIAPLFLKKDISPGEWEGFHDEQVSAHDDLRKDEGSGYSIPLPDSLLDAIANQIDDDNAWMKTMGETVDSKEEFSIQVKAKTAKALAKTAFAAMLEMISLTTNKPSLGAKESLGYLKKAQGHNKLWTWILTQLNMQGVTVDPDELSKYRELTNNLASAIRRLEYLEYIVEKQTYSSKN